MGYGWHHAASNIQRIRRSQNKKAWGSSPRFVVLIRILAVLEGEIGYTSNEPVMLCLMSAIETGVIFLINDGIDRGLWDLQNKADRQNDILVKYRELSVSAGNQ